MTTVANRPIVMNYSLRVETRPSVTILRSPGRAWLRATGALPPDPIRVAVNKVLAASRATPSAELVHDPRRHELEMVEIMQVENLKIDPAGTHACVLADLVDDFVRCSGES